MTRWMVTTVFVGASVVYPAMAGAQGATLYRRYCASCHGEGGAGDGPAAQALSPRPTDLRRYDADVRALMQVIDGRRTVRAHGDAAMPVWGAVLEGAKEGQRHPGRTTLLEVQALADYVRGLQERR